MQAVLPMREREGGEEEKIVGREKDSEQREQASERRIVDCGGRRRTEIAIVSRTMRLSATSPPPHTLSFPSSLSLSFYVSLSIAAAACRQQQQQQLCLSFVPSCPFGLFACSPRLSSHISPRLAAPHFAIAFFDYF